MKVLRSNNELKIVINPIQDFGVDLGWEDNFKEYEDDALRKVINPINNYETVRYSHKEYPIPLFNTEKQNDIWYYFYLLSGSTYVQNYETIGITLNENAKMLKQSTETFFRLEFYKTPNNDLPSRSNRRLVMTRNLSLPLSERYFNTTINDNIFIPIFTGSNFKNKENMYHFWFKDDTVFDDTELTGNTFWMTVKLYNADDGSIIDFVNKDLITTGTTITERVGMSGNPIKFYEKPSVGQEIVESLDLYYKVLIDRSDYTYQVLRF
jgi:hypothetical protein